MGVPLRSTGSNLCLTQIFTASTVSSDLLVSWKHLFIEETFAFVPLLYHQKCFVSLAISKLLSHTAYYPKLCGKLSSLLRCFFVYIGPEGFVLVFWKCPPLSWWTLHQLFFFTCVYTRTSADHHLLRLWSSVLSSYYNCLTVFGNAMQSTHK